MYKCEIPTIKAFVEKNYPILLKATIEVPRNVDFASGGGFYLNMKAFEILCQEHENFQPFPKDNETLMKNLTSDSEGHQYIKGVHAFDDLEVGVVMNKHKIRLTRTDVHGTIVKW